MRKLILLSLFLTCFSFAVPAQSVDIIVTRNGDTYEGFISRQIPGKSLTIQSYKTTMTVSSWDAEIFRSHKQMLGDLPDEYIQLFPIMPDDSFVEIAEVKVTDKDGREITFGESVILESGEELKFVSFAPYSCELKWNDIRLSEKAPYDFSNPFSLCDKLILPNGETLEGQLMGQNLQSGILKFRTLDGNVSTFKKSKVLSVRSEMLNQEDSIWQRLPYCDKIILKDGSSEDGFIVSKLFGENVTVQQYNSDISRVIPVSDIVSYEKYRNPLYVVPEIKEHQEALSDLYVNGVTYPLRQLVSNRGKYYVNSSVSSLGLSLHVRETIVFKYKISARTSQIRVAKAKLVKERVLGISGMTLRDKGSDLWPSFKDSDIMTNPNINIQSNDGEFIEADISFSAPGVYVIWINGEEECITLSVI